MISCSSLGVPAPPEIPLEGVDLLGVHDDAAPGARPQIPGVLVAGDGLEGVQGNGRVGEVPVDAQPASHNLSFLRRQLLTPIRGVYS